MSLLWRRLRCVGPVLRRSRDEPAAVAVRVLHLRPGLARPLALVARWTPREDLTFAVHALTAGMAGDASAVRRAAEHAARRPLRRRVPLAHVCVALGMPRLARDLLGPGGLVAGAPALRVAALAASAVGDVDGSVELASRAMAAAPGSAPCRRTARRLDGDGIVRTLGWWPRVDGGPGAPESWPVWSHLEAARPLRVLHVLSNSLPHYQAGYTIRSQQVLSAQRAAGIAALAVTRDGFPADHGLLGAAPWEVHDGVPYARIRPHAGDAPADRRVERTAEGLARLVARLHPDVLHPASTYGNALAALAVGSRAGIPVVYEVRGFEELTWLSAHGAEALEPARVVRDRQRETECMLAADAVVTLGVAMRDELIRRGVAADHVTVVPNGVDVDRFHPVTADPALRARLGIDRGETVLGYVSSLTDYEGVHHLVDAAALLRRGGYRVSVLVVGDGPARGGLEERARQRGVADHVVFTGRVPASGVLDYYALIDVFVTPRTTARVCQLVTPLKPFEAMATGRALVVSGLPALCEIIDEGRTGLSFTPEDPASLAAVCVTLVDDPDRRRRLGAAAREWIVEHRTWDRVVARYRDVYAAVRGD